MSAADITVVVVVVLLVERCGGRCCLNKLASRLRPAAPGVLPPGRRSCQVPAASSVMLPTAPLHSRLRDFRCLLFHQVVPDSDAARCAKCSTPSAGLGVGGSDAAGDAGPRPGSSPTCRGCCRGGYCSSLMMPGPQMPPPKHGAKFVSVVTMQVTVISAMTILCA